MHLVRDPRARRYVLRVNDDGSLRLTLPRWGSLGAARRFARAERAWIERERARLLRMTQPPMAAADRAGLRRRAERELPARLRQLAVRHGFAVGRGHDPRSAEPLGILLAEREHLAQLASDADAGRTCAITSCCTSSPTCGCRTTPAASGGSCPSSARPGRRARPAGLRDGAGPLQGVAPGPPTLTWRRAVERVRLRTAGAAGAAGGATITGTPPSGPAADRAAARRARVPPAGRGPPAARFASACSSSSRESLSSS